MKRVLLIGVDPKLIDHSSAQGVDPEEIRTAGRDAEARLREVSIHRQSRWLYGCWPLKGA